MLITSFGDGAGSKLKAVKQLPFEVTVNRVVTQAPAKQLPDRANASRFFFAFLWALLAIPSWLGGPHAIGVWSFRGDGLTFLSSGAFH
jgi:hypothetical protein